MIPRPRFLDELILRINSDISVRNRCLGDCGLLLTAGRAAGLSVNCISTALISYHCYNGAFQDPQKDTRWVVAAAIMLAWKVWEDHDDMKSVRKYPDIIKTVYRVIADDLHQDTPGINSIGEWLDNTKGEEIRWLKHQIRVYEKYILHSQLFVVPPDALLGPLRKSSSEGETRTLPEAYIRLWGLTAIAASDDIPQNLKSELTAELLEAAIDCSLDFLRTPMSLLYPPYVLAICCLWKSALHLNLDGAVDYLENLESYFNKEITDQISKSIFECLDHICTAYEWLRVMHYHQYRGRCRNEMDVVVCAQIQN